MAIGAHGGTNPMTANDALASMLSVLRRNRSGEAVGVWSVCSAHPLVLEAAMRQARRDQAPILIEATANQVNQSGGYTGLQPGEFSSRVARIADRAGLAPDRVVLGGDHLGPVCWTNETADVAMARARELVKRYVEAGVVKIHLDTSMPCAGDPDALTDENVAARAAELCAVAEQTANSRHAQAKPVYIIGTEVPPPGGAKDKITQLEVTSGMRARQSIDAHERAFAARGLSDAWSRVIGVVVQPGVEFDHSTVHRYCPETAGDLSDSILEIPNLVYEAHSTDYQPASAYRELLRDHFAILKVGPQLTFALREALFALSAVENELLDGAEKRSSLPEVCDRVMTDQPKHWIRHYPAEGPEARWYRRYSYSDRIRYYWSQPQVSSAVDLLFANLSKTGIPSPILSQFLPAQATAIRDGALLPEPRDLVMHRIMQVMSVYSAACRGTA